MRPFLVSCICMLAIAALGEDPVAQKPRVFISDSLSWEMSGSGGSSGGNFAAHSQGGARPQTAEIVKTFGERCPDVIVNNKAEKSDYVVLLDHEGGKGYVRRDNKVAVFNSDGDSIVSHSTRSLGNAVKDACEAITKDWPVRAAQLAPRGATAPQPAAPPAQAELRITSAPDAADIEVDGSFVGNTPSTIGVAPGDHQLSLKKPGFKPWERKITVSSGQVNVNAELEPETK